MNPTHVVLRPVDAGGKRNPGEMVDARDWRHVEFFVESRRLRPVMLGEVGVDCVCGRQWLTFDQAAAHCGTAPQGEQPEPEGQPEPVAVRQPVSAVSGRRELTTKQRAYYARGR